MEVPEIPLSYNSTGAKKIVTPNALIQPAIVSKRIFFQRSPFKISNAFFNKIPAFLFESPYN